MDDHGLHEIYLEHTVLLDPESSDDVKVPGTDSNDRTIGSGVKSYFPAKPAKVEDRVLVRNKSMTLCILTWTTLVLLPLEETTFVIKDIP